MIAVDKKLRVGDRQLQPASISVLGQQKTVIAFGHMEYELVFTNLNKAIYRPQLDEMAAKRDFQGQQPGLSIDPTPAKTDYVLMQKYIIRGSFARGLTCWLCTAVIRDTGAQVAVKKIIANTPRMLSSYVSEVYTMKKLQLKRPPSSIAMFVDSLEIRSTTDSGITECFIVSQPLIEDNLEKLIRSSSLSRSSRSSLLVQMLEGLAFIHNEKCMHRDIKPQNILISRSPLRAVIIDFGCATWDRTSADHMKGTIRYLAPEIIALKEKTITTKTVYDISADIWSMGLTAYELMLSLQVRFQRISRAEYDQELLPVIRSHTSQSRNVTEEWEFAVIEDMLRWDAKSQTTADQAYQKCLVATSAMERRQLQTGKRAFE